MKFDSTECAPNEYNSYYGAVRAVVDEEGNGNSEVTVLEFETPSGFAQPMEITIFTGDGVSPAQVFMVEDTHTVRIKITGAWEGGEIKQGLADFVHVLKLKSILE